MKFGIRELIFFVVLLAVPLASYFYVFKPHNEDIQKAREELEHKEEALSRLAAMDAEIADIQTAIEEGRENIRIIESKLPSANGVHEILEQITQIAKRNRLHVKRFETHDDVPAATYREKPIRMEIDGSFDGFYEFLIELENLPRITRVHELKLERLEEKELEEYSGDTLGWMRAEFELSIYFQPRTIDGLVTAGD